jgi:hypothetical protein
VRARRDLPNGWWLSGYGDAGGGFAIELEILRIGLRAHLDPGHIFDPNKPAALRRLVGGGTKLRPFPRPVMEACEKAAYELYDELQAKSEHWKRVYPSWKKFRDEQFLWFRVAESTYDNYTFYSKIGAGK